MTRCQTILRGGHAPVRFGMIVHTNEGGPCEGRFMVLHTDTNVWSIRVMRLNDYDTPNYTYPAGFTTSCHLGERSQWHLAEDQG
jgi:hypothetical protein